MNKEIAKLQKIAGLLKENLEEGTGSQAEKLEGLLSDLTRNVSTDSNIPTASKEGLLNAFNEMMDIVQDILGSEEADSFYDEDEPVSDYSKRRMQDRY